MYKRIKKIFELHKEDNNSFLKLTTQTQILFLMQIFFLEFIIHRNIRAHTVVAQRSVNTTQPPATLKKNFIKRKY